MMSASEWLDYARLAKYNMGSYPSATPDYAADQAAFGSVAASWANIEKPGQEEHTTLQKLVRMIGLLTENKPVLLMSIH